MFPFGVFFVLKAKLVKKNLGVRNLLYNFAPTIALYRTIIINIKTFSL